MQRRTLYQKIWDDHVIEKQDDGTCLIYIDRHLVHEVTSPQAFEGLRLSGRKLRKPQNTLAVLDHNVPTTDRSLPIEEGESKTQIETLRKNCKEFGVQLFDLTDKRQGVVHIIGPEQGFTLPAMTIVCGDSHTSTHGAFGSLAFGIGTSEVEHVMATQTLIQKPSKNMRITINGELPTGVSSKDLILHIIGEIGTAGGTGYVIEYAGDVIESLSMESRMTICNMSIEAGARAGLIAPDDTTFEYIKDRPMSPKGAELEQAIKYWKTMFSDKNAVFDKEIIINAADIAPTLTWGTTPEDVVPITGCVPYPSDFKDPAKQKSVAHMLDYMGLESGTKMCDIPIDVVFIGSCTNGRIEDLREVAAIVDGKKLSSNIVSAMIVPGSGLVKEQAELEGIADILIKAGFDWREAGCSMCLGMNPDQLKPQQRCASTSNRNFEGRQGRASRTHLVSPAMAGAAAITGKLTDVRKIW